MRVSAREERFGRRIACDRQLQRIHQIQQQQAIRSQVFPDCIQCLALIVEIRKTEQTVEGDDRERKVPSSQRKSRDVLLYELDSRV